MLGFAGTGYLLARALRPADDGIERLAVALLAAPLAIGWLLVLSTILTDAPAGVGHLLVIALLLCVGAVGVLRQRGDGLGLRLQAGDVAILAVAIAVGVVFLVHYDRDLFQFNCVNRAAALVLGFEGHPDWADVESTSTYILAGNRNVRLGNACLVAPMFIAFEFVGPRLLYAWVGVGLFVWGVVLGRRTLGSRGAALALGLALALNPWVLQIPILDENLFACLAATVLLATLAERRPAPLWLGLIAGYLVGFRHLALLMLPAAIWGFSRRAPRRRDWLVFGAALAVVGALWALHHQRVFGSPLVFESFEEYHADHLHRFLGVEFGFRGLLNAPFHEHVVRTPYNPYPSGAMLVIWTLNRFGLLACALAPLGLWAMRREPLPPRLLLALTAPVLALLVVLENTMQPNKIGIVLMLLPCLVLAMVRGGALVWEQRRWPPFALWLAVAATLAGLQLALASWDAPADERVYTLEDPVRRERPEYVAWERQHLVRHNLFPDVARVAEYTAFEPGRKLADAAFDLTHREGIARRDRPAPLPAEAAGDPIRLVVTLRAPLIGAEEWLTVAAASDAPDWRLDPAAGATKAAYTLPPLDWSELPARVGVLQRPSLGRVDVMLEFGAGFSTFGDLSPAGLPDASRALTAPRLVLEVPRGTRVRVTEVVADHFSRYYRWDVRTAPEVRVTLDPMVVFTN